MQYDVIKLREAFPALAKEPLDKLRSNREAYCRSVGLIGRRAAFREPTLTAYCPDNAEELGTDFTRPTVILCPGGSYQHISFQEPMALAFVSRGYNVFLLDYSVAPVRYPAALLELAASVIYLRQHATRFHVHPDAITLAGFSAGGHLVACLGTEWKQSFLSSTFQVSADSLKPNAMILGYPVISFKQFVHKGTCECLLGNCTDDGMNEQLSLENRVSSDTPPTFLWHTVADPAVPVENSLLFAQALQKQGIPFELHLYPQGGHGLSLATAETAKGDPTHINPHCATWLTLCDQWLHLVFSSFYA